MQCYIAMQMDENLKTREIEELAKYNGTEKILL